MKIQCRESGLKLYILIKKNLLACGADGAEVAEN